MEVCGGHTAAIRRFGLTSILPPGINLISGPGCPVCVTSIDFIDRLVAYSRLHDTVIATFGDLLRVPGSQSSLESERSAGADIRIVFSGFEALRMAESEPLKTVIFPGIGFETTAPGTAVVIKQAAAMRLKNFLVLSAHKVMPPAMEVVAGDGANIDGFICPGHVASVTGSDPYRFLPEKYKIGCVVSGFEPLDLLQSVLMLVNQKNCRKPLVEIQYSRAVTPEGNTKAQRLLCEVFESCNATWRGFGTIPGSGLKIRDLFASFDAEAVIPLDLKSPAENISCICGEILRGIKKPCDCMLFRNACTPDNPVGACMVSSEGSCNTFFRFS
jgi:hydrogenase expression/formation protein HypD